MVLRVNLGFAGTSSARKVFDGSSNKFLWVHDMLPLSSLQLWSRLIRRNKPEMRVKGLVCHISLVKDCIEIISMTSVTVLTI